MVDKDAVMGVFEQIKPLFLEHEGDFEVLDISDNGNVRVKLIGQCQMCMYKEKTVRALEKMMVAANAGVTAIEAE
ncbi:MAG: NifU family protein [Spirochaetales bacterium]|nr:NifU family protein [Spirochaetales bacterium]